MISFRSGINYGKQIGKTARNGSKAFQKIVDGENVVTVLDKDGNVTKTLKSKTDVLWNGIISKTKEVYDSNGNRTDLHMSSFQPNWGVLENTHIKYGDVKKEIRNEMRIDGDKMSLKHTQLEGNYPQQSVVESVVKDDIEIKNPRYDNCGGSHVHDLLTDNKYANEIYKAAGSKFYNRWLR